MTAPLFEVKSKFSEFVGIVEKGDTLFVTKHGKIVAVMQSYNEYNQKNSRKSFMESYTEWYNSCDPDLNDDEDFDPWANVRDRALDVGEKNVWD